MRDGPTHSRTPMVTRLYRATLYTLYQLSLGAGIALMPVAMLSNKAGLQLPVHRIVRTFRNAYDDARGDK